MAIYQPLGDLIACPTCGKPIKGYTTVNPDVTGPNDPPIDDPRTFVADPCNHPFASISFPKQGKICTVRPLDDGEAKEPST